MSLKFITPSVIISEAEYQNSLTDIQHSSKDKLKSKKTQERAMKITGIKQLH